MTFWRIGRSFGKGGWHSGRVTLEAIGELLQRRDMIRWLYRVLVTAALRIENWQEERRPDRSRPHQ